MLDEMRLNENYTGLTFFHARGGPKSSPMSFYDGMGWTDTARPDPAGLRNFRRRIRWGGEPLRWLDHDSSPGVGLARAIPHSRSR